MEKKKNNLDGNEKIIFYECLETLISYLLFKVTKILIIHEFLKLKGIHWLLIA